MFSPFRTKVREAQDIVVSAQLKQIFPDDGGWYSPPTGEVAEIKSMQVHYAGIIPRDFTVPEKVINVVAASYPITEPFPDINDNMVWNFLINLVNSNSSPGYPLANCFILNKEILSNPVAITEVVEKAKARLRKLQNITPQELTEKLKTEINFAVDNDLADLIRIFIKNEPHPMRKKLIGKNRIINSDGLVHFMVCLFIFHVQDKTEIDNWREVPSKCGFGLTDNDCEDLQHYVENHGLNHSSDVSAWDASVAAPLLLAEAEVRIKLARNAPAWWPNVVRNLYILGIYRVLASSSGKLFVLKVPGGVYSGAKTTASSNSRMRYLLNVWFNMTKSKPYGAMTMGDDAVERLDNCDEEEYAAFLAALGIKLTDTMRIDATHFSFCSHLIINGAPKPEAPMKMIINYMTKPLAESRSSLLENMRHSEILPSLLKYLDGVPLANPEN